MIDALSKLLAIDLSKIVDEKNKFFSFIENANQLHLLMETAQAAVDNQDYLSELPQNVRQNIESNLTSLVAVLEQIEANRDNRDWMTAQYAAQSERITQLYNELYEYFIRGVREYVNSLSTTRRATQRTLSQLRRAAKETDDTVQQAKEATSELSTATLSQYYESEVLSRRDLIDLPSLSWLKRWSYVRRFWRRWVSAKGYEASADRWFVLTLIAIAFTTYVAYREFHGIPLGKIDLNSVLARALLLTAPAYAIRFCVRNYNANKHLATVNRQRATVLKTLLAFMSSPGVTDATREQVIVAAANQAFATSESGYITLRDGAGSSDTVFDLTAVTKKT